jgi:hypothetical protein
MSARSAFTASSRLSGDISQTIYLLTAAHRVCGACGTKLPDPQSGKAEP